VLEGAVGSPSLCPNESVKTETSPNSTYGSTQCPNDWIVQSSNPNGYAALFQVDFATPPSAVNCSSNHIEFSIWGDGGLSFDQDSACSLQGGSCICTVEAYMPAGKNVRAVAAAYTQNNRNKTAKVKVTRITDCGL
jgi:hypothetical protein